MKYAMALIGLISATPLLAIHFPDTSDFKKEYRIAARQDGRPSDFFRSVDGDSASIHLDWETAAPSNIRVTGVRYERGREFEPDSFSVLVAAYGGGAAWHEWSGSAEAKKLYPGLEQQWLLKGYGGEQGWVGSGVLRGRFFVVFRETTPGGIPMAEGPLRLSRNLFVSLDTSSQWLHVPCPSANPSDNPAAAASVDRKSTGKTASKSRLSKPGKNPPFCFTADEDSRMLIRIDRKDPLSVQAWLDEGESSSLADIKKAMESVPDDDQSDYAKDLSQMLLGEAQMFLVKLSQRAPGLFNWPSWQLQDFKAGQIPAAGFLDLVRRNRNAGDTLPAFQFEDKGIKMAVTLSYAGKFHMQADAKP